MWEFAGVERVVRGALGRGRRRRFGSLGKEPRFWRLILEDIYLPRNLTFSFTVDTNLSNAPFFCEAPSGVKQSGSSMVFQAAVI